MPQRSAAPPRSTAAGQSSGRYVSDAQLAVFDAHAKIGSRDARCAPVTEWIAAATLQ